MSRPPSLSKASPSQNKKTYSAWSSTSLSCSLSTTLLIPRDAAFFPPDQVFREIPPIILTGGRSFKGEHGQCSVFGQSRASHFPSPPEGLSCDAGWIASICLFQVLSLNCSTVPDFKTTCYVARLSPLSTEPSREPPAVWENQSRCLLLVCALSWCLSWNPGPCVG